MDAAQRYIEHESDVMESVVGLRAMAGREVNEQDAAEADQISAGALGRLLATAESYPDLKADESFQNLQRSLNEVEEQISAARRSYNMAAKQMNDALRMFPTNLLARTLGWTERAYFDAPVEHHEPPDVMGRFRSHED